MTEQEKNNRAVGPIEDEEAAERLRADIERRRKLAAEEGATDVPGLVDDEKRLADWDAKQGGA